MRRTNIYLTEPQQKTLKRAAAKIGVKMSELIRRILDEWIAKEQK